MWPFLWLVQLALTAPRERLFLHAAWGLAHGCLIVALSILVIDAGYLFEGVGIPLGRFEFASGSLTRPVAGGIRHAPATKNWFFAMLWPFRENRFRNTVLAGLPVPLPEHYVLGFDEQKIETEGIPNRLTSGFPALRAGDPATARKEAGSADNSVAGYPVYLNGELRDSGWWDYYFCALLYKVPEGTWMLVLLSMVVLFLRTRTRESWFDEICLATVPLVVLFAMSFLTNINLGLRYVLSIFPYVLIAVGKVVPWMEGLSGTRRAAARSFVAGCVLMTIGATVQISPHYLAYFNWASGGPDRAPARLIDSNLDWGQDLVALREWCRENLGDQPIGLAYFGQINPSIFTLRGDPFPWFLPPVMPGTTKPMDNDPPLPPRRLIGPARRLSPGYYAVSATLVHGLPGGSMILLPPCPMPGPPRGTPRNTHSVTSSSSRPSSGSAIRSTSTSSARPMLTGSTRSWSRQGRGSHRQPSFNLLANIHLREVIFGGRAEMHGHIEARRAEDFREIGPELGEYGITDVTAGMTDLRCPQLVRAIGTNHGPSERLGYAGQQGNREDVPAAGLQNPVDLAQGCGQIGHVLKSFGREHKVERLVRIGQSSQVFRSNTANNLAGRCAGLIVGEAQVGQTVELLVQPFDPVDLGDAQRSGQWRARPVGERPGR